MEKLGEKRQKSAAREVQGPCGMMAHSNEGRKFSMTREHKARKIEIGLER